MARLGCVSANCAACLALSHLHAQPCQSLNHEAGFHKTQPAAVAVVDKVRAPLTQLDEILHLFGQYDSGSSPTPSSICTVFSTTPKTDYNEQVCFHGNNTVTQDFGPRSKHDCQ